MVREVFSINATQDQRVTFSLIFHTERESQPRLLTHIAATVPALQGSQWKLCISHLLHHTCVSIIIIIIIILLQMGHFLLHGWLLFQYFLLSSPNMQCACLDPTAAVDKGVKSTVQKVQGGLVWLTDSVVLFNPSQTPIPASRPPFPIQTSQWATAGLVSDYGSTCYIDKFHPNSDKTDQHVTAAKAIPRISQVNKMDLSLCWFSQNHSCVFFPLFSEACSWIFVAGKKSSELLTESRNM